jgi:hypothetical protein
VLNFGEAIKIVVGCWLNVAVRLHEFFDGQRFAHSHLLFYVLSLSYELSLKPQNGQNSLLIESALPQLAQNLISGCSTVACEGSAAILYLGFFVALDFIGISRLAKLWLVCV